MSTTLLEESSFVWVCPKCTREQTEVITIHGPVMSLHCAGCENEFDAGNLPESVCTAWRTAIDQVVPKHEGDD